MPPSKTSRFRDLKPTAAAAVVDAFLGDESSVEFTEKLAGQHLTAVVNPDGTVRYAIKTSDTPSSGGYFYELEQVLRYKHPQVSTPVTYRFEVLKRDRRPDYIDYPLKAKVTAIEYSGAMRPETAKVLNDNTSGVAFLTKDDIRKSVAGTVTDPGIRTRLERFRDRARAGGRIPKDEMLQVEEMLMDMIDAGRVPSTLGGPALEGLFGVVEDEGFKIPSRSYADLQLQQSKFYAVIKSGKSYEVPDRFERAVQNPAGDKLVSDVLQYIDSMLTAPPRKGFKVFFSPKEIRSLKQQADAYRSGDTAAGRDLASRFFDRIYDRSSWVASDITEMRRIMAQSSSGERSSNYSRIVVRLIRETVRQYLLARL